MRDLTYDTARATFAYQEGMATVDAIDLAAAGGTLRGRARVDVKDPATPRFESQVTVRNMVVEQLAGAGFPDLAHTVRGTLDADATMSGAGVEWPVLRRTLRANGTAEVKNGVLVDVNIAEQVLGGAGVGGLATLVPARVRQKYPSVFGTGDTRFDRLGGSVRVADGVARSNDLTAATRDYTMHGAGTVTLDGVVDILATLVASEALTKDLAGDVKEIRYLTDTAGRVALPFRVTGTAPHLHATPDAGFVAKALQRGLLDQGVNALLGKKDKAGKKGKNDSLKKELEQLLGR